MIDPFDPESDRAIRSLLEAPHVINLESFLRALKTIKPFRVPREYRVALKNACDNLATLIRRHPLGVSGPQLTLRDGAVLLVVMWLSYELLLPAGRFRYVETPLPNASIRLVDSWIGGEN